VGPAHWGPPRLASFRGSAAATPYPGHYSAAAYTAAHCSDPAATAVAAAARATAESGPLFKDTHTHPPTSAVYR
jgi:hypothetical protein